MMLAASSDIKKLDASAVTDYGISEEQLMNNAAKALFEQLTSDFDIKTPFAVFCGKGKNGGDGLLLALNIVRAGGYAKVYLCFGDEQKINPLTKLALDRVRAFGIETVSFREPVQNDAVIIDALLGIGISGAAEGDIKTAIDIINLYPNQVVSVDMPSGLIAENGNFFGSVVNASKTYTLALDKIGLNLYPGLSVCGEKTVLDIGIPAEATEKLNISCIKTTDEYAKDKLPPRKRNSHKGDYGKIGIIGGSPGMTGSICLAAKSALRAGAGLVYVFVPDDIFNIVSIKLEEAVIVRESQLESYLPELDAAAIGMGAQNNPKFKSILKTVLLKYTNKLLIDADGINVLSEDTKIMARKKCSVVLTPHIVEFSRLSGLSVNEIQNNILFNTSKLASQLNATVLLKGPTTIISNPKKEILLSTTGNSAMATAGSGDVLSGIIASVMGQGAEPFDAAGAGAHIHGLSGEVASKELTEYSVNASDIIDYLPYAIKKIL